MAVIAGSDSASDVAQGDARRATDSAILGDLAAGLDLLDVLTLGYAEMDDIFAAGDMDARLRPKALHADLVLPEGFVLADPRTWDASLEPLVRDLSWTGPPTFSVTGMVLHDELIDAAVGSGFAAVSAGPALPDILDGGEAPQAAAGSSSVPATQPAPVDDFAATPAESASGFTSALAAIQGVPDASIVNAATVSPAPPIVIGKGVTLSTGQSVAASSLIASAFDPDPGDSIDYYAFFDNGNGGGYFTVNGVAQASGNFFVVAAGALGTVQYVAGAQSWSETLYIDVHDGDTWSGAQASLTAITLGSGPVSAVRTISQTGASSNRVDMIFLGDGYTSSQIAGTYTAHIQDYLSYLFNDSALTQPFGRYENFFNIYAIDVISNQSGADNPGLGITRDTALNATYRFDGVTDRLLYVNDGLALTAMNVALAGKGIGAEMRYVLVNDTTYGGGGGQFGVYAAGNAAARDVALHEIGHSFAGLADEYDDNNPGVTTPYTGIVDPSEINVTTNSAGAKWAEWIGYSDPILGTVGAYQGGRYVDTGIYRPTDNSKMRSLDRPFDAIAREEFIHRFYALVNPLDGHDNNVGVRTNVPTLSVDTIDPNVILVDWTVNGQTFVNVGETFNFANHGFFGGTFTVTARAYDPTDWVRGDRSDLEQTVTWTVVNQGKQAPVANADTVAATEDTQVTIKAATLLANDTDVDAGETLTLVSVTSGTGGTASLVSGNVVFTPTANFAGAATFNYTISDGTFTSSPGTVTVNVAGVNDAPVSVADTVAATEDVAVTFKASTLLGNDTDVDAGTTLSIASVTAGTGGTVSLVGGDVLFTPSANFNGVASFTYVASDGIATSASATVTVNVAAVNDVPVAVADTLAATEDTPVTFKGSTLRANDIDAEGVTLAIASVTSGVGGTAAQSGGNVIFTPFTNFTGAATFTYTVTDGVGTSAPATVTINVAGVNDAPAARADSNTGDVVVEAGVNADNTPFAGDASASGNVLTNDTDVDAGDSKTVTTTGTFTGTYGTLTLAANGAWTYALNNADPDTNALTQGQAVTDVFNYTMRDGVGLTSSSKLSVGISGTKDLAPLTVIETAGSTDLVTEADRYFFGTGGPTLRYQGAAVTAGQFGGWTPLGVEASPGGGYDVVWKNGGANEYIAWHTDGSGNLIAMGSVLTGTSTELLVLETLLDQNFNGTGGIGVTLTTIETAGATDLLSGASRYFLRNVSTTGPTVKFGGADVVAGQFGDWTPIGAEASVGGGYDVVWKFGGADQYIAWHLDGAGNLLSMGSVVSGLSAQLQVLETLLGQNLNGAGPTGVTLTTLETAGATDLVTGSDRFFLGAGGTSIPTLKFQGADVVAGQFGGWAPIGVEALGGGYDVVWKNGGADEYIAWHTDGNGNLLSMGSVVSGGSAEMQVLETLLDQNLNGTGPIGVTLTTIETAGAIDLTSGANRYLFRTGITPGPTLKFGGADVVVGQFGGWTPLGVEAAAGGGYDVVWKNGGANEYIAWRTDSNGNLLSMSDVMSDGSYPLQELENTLGQNLNGDGTTGFVSTVIETAGATDLLTQANHYVFGSGGPTLMYLGAAVTSGQFGGWAPIGAEALGGGFDVVWKMNGADQYIAWHVDSGGNLISMGNVVSGGSTELQVLETLLEQNLNGSGGTGLALTVIETAGTTDLSTGANRYFFETGSTSGPTLKYMGADVVAGQFGGWTPLGVEASAGGGYDVVWKNGGANEYIAWHTDDNGNVASMGPVVPGSSYTLQALEDALDQDFNSDGTAGFAMSLIEEAGSIDLFAQADRYIFDSTGPTLRYEGAAVTSGQFGAWTPLGAEAAGGGYDVVWKNGGADEYIAWRTDSGGNMTSMGGVMAGNSAALRAFETGWGQDLNGDWFVG